MQFIQSILHHHGATYPQLSPVRCALLDAPLPYSVDIFEKKTNPLLTKQNIISVTIVASDFRYQNLANAPSCYVDKKYLSWRKVV